MTEFRLPRETGNLPADWRAARAALDAATTDAQRAAVRLRIESLAARDHAHLHAVFAGMRQAVEHVSRVFAETARQLFPQLAEARRLADEYDDRAAAALAARRHRSTGPAQRRRPPKRIDPRGVYR